MTSPSSRNCTYCDIRFTSKDERERFCSDRCRALFRVKHGLEEPQGFVLAQELQRIQDKIKAFRISSDADNLEKRLLLYEEVVERTALSLKWINDQAMQSDRHQLEEKVHQMELELQEMTEQMERVLQKLNETKKENQHLKLQLRKLSSSDPKHIARTLLGLEEPFTPDELKKSYRVKAKKVHPDTPQGDDALFKMLTWALNTLKT